MFCELHQFIFVSACVMSELLCVSKMFCSPSICSAIYDCVYFVSVDYDSTTACTTHFPTPRSFVCSLVRSFVCRDVDPKISKMIVRVAAIDPGQFSSKSELSSRFLGRSKFFGRAKIRHATFGRIKPNVPGFISKPLTNRTFPGTFVSILRKVAKHVSGILGCSDMISCYDEMLL